MTIIFKKPVMLNVYFQSVVGKLPRKKQNNVLLKSCLVAKKLLYNISCCWGLPTPCVLTYMKFIHWNPLFLSTMKNMSICWLAWKFHLSIKCLEELFQTWLSTFSKKVTKGNLAMIDDIVCYLTLKPSLEICP